MHWEEKKMIWGAHHCVHWIINITKRTHLHATVPGSYTDAEKLLLTHMFNIWIKKHTYVYMNMSTYSCFKWLIQVTVHKKQPIVKFLLKFTVTDEMNFGSCLWLCKFDFFFLSKCFFFWYDAIDQIWWHHTSIFFSKFYNRFSSALGSSIKHFCASGFWIWSLNCLEKFQALLKIHCLVRRWFPPTPASSVFSSFPCCNCAFSGVSEWKWMDITSLWPSLNAFRWEFPLVWHSAVLPLPASTSILSLNLNRKKSLIFVYIFIFFNKLNITEYKKHII